MGRSSRSIAKTVLAVLMLSGCATSISERFSPEIEEAKYVVNLGVCHGADVIRFTTTGVTNVFVHSVGGFVYLAAKGGSAVSNPLGLVALGVAGGVHGTGAGVVKTFEDWESGVDDCLQAIGYGAPTEEHLDAPTSS